jgi:hypothetical protein
MAEKKIALLCSLPEGRPSKTPTIEQVLRLFENQNKHALYDGDRLIKQFADPLTPVQSQILQLLSIPTAVYGPAKVAQPPGGGAQSRARRECGM